MVYVSDWEKSSYYNYPHFPPYRVRRDIQPVRLPSVAEILMKIKEYESHPQGQHMHWSPASTSSFVSDISNSTAATTPPREIGKLNNLNTMAQPIARTSSFESIKDTLLPSPVPTHLNNFGSPTRASSGLNNEISPSENSIESSQSGSLTGSSGSSSPGSTDSITKLGHSPKYNSKHHSPKKRRSSKKKSKSNGRSKKPKTHCHQCGLTSTPEWRRGPTGSRSLCNACGIYYMKLLRRFTEDQANSIFVFKKNTNTISERIIPSFDQMAQMSGEVQQHNWSMLTGAAMMIDSC
ncbi:uncharacterized protein CXQ87_004892 [Candidozyma duobushaemuli]|uniref:GATA-type domain-containing protein n=2 Tax=Candidozyma TaxID=3303203 RepID=A0ABX8IHK4_9ASCO|nr:uncharacterized protein CXQ87_004892 [[Candida] duobushaemulonis]PVH16597.1 hypothetical protein CXQ87_004892 [[Candida] duobushaemulonis]QWU90356.1 hypothetical protein CA3LBN_004717 [[Candida] haemuloni]